MEKFLYELTMIFFGSCAVIYGLMHEVIYVLTKVCVLIYTESLEHSHMGNQFILSFFVILKTK
jgi:hypothetical protein